MMELRFDRFYRYDELVAILQGFAARRPELFALEAIGRSHEMKFTNKPGSGWPEKAMPRRLSSSAICGSTLTVVKCCGSLLPASEGKDPVIRIGPTTRSFTSPLSRRCLNSL